MKLLVGCPLYRREWCIAHYLDYAEAAAVEAGFRPDYLFVGPQDDPTMLLIDEWSREHRRRAFLEPEPQNDDPGEHTWNPTRYEFMAQLRNRLLGAVRQLEPELFLSLDSDILLNQRALLSALEGVGQFDAVGLKVHMFPGLDHPSYAMLRGIAGLERQEWDGFGRVDVIMAAKLMTSVAYNVDYSAHHLGEDVGWSINCRDQGVILGFDGRITSKHLMTREQLDQIDPRCGY